MPRRWLQGSAQGFNPISANLLCWDMFEPGFFVHAETLIIHEQYVAS